MRWPPLLALLVTIDRIEGDFAVVELPDARTVDVPLAALPRGIEEGDRVLLRARPFHVFRSRPASRRRPRAAARAVARTEQPGPTAPSGEP